MWGCCVPIYRQGWEFPLGSGFQLGFIHGWVVKSGLLMAKFRETSSNLGFSAAPFGTGFLMVEV